MREKRQRQLGVLDIVMFCIMTLSMLIGVCWFATGGGTDALLVFLLFFTNMNIIISRMHAREQHRAKSEQEN